MTDGLAFGQFVAQGHGLKAMLDCALQNRVVEPDSEFDADAPCGEERQAVLLDHLVG